MKNRVRLQGSCKPEAECGHNPGEAVPQQSSGVVTEIGPTDSPAIIRHELGPRSAQKI